MPASVKGPAALFPVWAKGPPVRAKAVRKNPRKLGLFLHARPLGKKTFRLGDTNAGKSFILREDTDTP